MAKNRAPGVAGSRYLKQDLGEDYPDMVEEEDDDPTAPSSTAPVVCIYEGPAVRFEIAGRKYRMRAGDVEQLQVGYVAQRQANAQGDPIPSAIELMTGRKVLPVSDPRVPKNPDGIPLVVVQARAAAQREAAHAASAKGQGQPGAGKAQ